MQPLLWMSYVLCSFDSAFVCLCLDVSPCPAVHICRIHVLHLSGGAHWISSVGQESRGLLEIYTRKVKCASEIGVDAKCCRSEEVLDDAVKVSRAHIARLTNPSIF